MRLLPLFGVLLFAAAPARAQPSDLTGFAFLRLEPSARAAALGGSFSAVYGGDVNVLFYNPAGLDESTHGALSLSYLNHLSDLNAGAAAYARHVDGVGTLGGGLRFLSYGELEEADETGERTGTFGATDVALTLGGARASGERLRYGASVHAVLSTIDVYRGSALAVDVGSLYAIPDQRLALSASVNNLGVTLSSLGASRDRLPVDVRLGVAKRLRYLPLLLSVTGYNLHDVGDRPEDATALDAALRHVALGGELQLSDAFHLRVGYNHRRHQELKVSSRLDLAGVGLGFGVEVAGFGFDYAFNSWSTLGGLHQFTLQTRL